MTPPYNKILAEIIDDSSESVIMTSGEEKKEWVRAKVLGVGEKAGSVKEGDEIIVFNVYIPQIHEWEGKRIIFVNHEEGFYFKLNS